MNTRTLRIPLLALILVVAAFAVAPLADEGFWPYNSIPKAAIKAKYKFDVTDTWLNHLQLATVRFGGGTGSIVSPDGLVLTNHHIGLSSLQRLSTAEKDLVKNGFLAATRADELKVSGMSLSVLQSIEDVTAKVTAAVTPTMTPQEVAAARQKVITAIQGEAQTGVSKQVVSLYAGAVYNLYTYKVYSDVRLVFGVEYNTGFFGGDPDNFTYPRYAVDVSMFRLYENDKPAQTPNYLKWSPNGSKEGDLVFTTGHPGSTQRLNTVAHLKYRRDLAIPYAIASNEMREAAVKKWMALSAENARQSTQELFGIQNSLKSQRGQLKGLQDNAIMAQKEASEKRLRAELAKNAAKQKELGDAWDVIEKSIASRAQDRRRAQLRRQRGRPEFDAVPAGAADRARGLQPGARRRRPGRAARRRPAWRRRTGGARRRAARRRGGRPERGAREDQPHRVARVHAEVPRSEPRDREAHSGRQNARGARHRAHREDPHHGPRNQRPPARRRQGRGGRGDRPDDRPRAHRSRPGRRRSPRPTTTRWRRSRPRRIPKIGQAVFVVDGAKAYPDATGTLRLSYGTVKNYKEDGKIIPPYTYVPGLYERSAQNGNRTPYELAPKWAEAKSVLDPKTAFNMVTTNDIVGGNSGSAMVNKKGELVGLIFDGNIQSLPGYFIYEESVNRAVSVDSRMILESLRKVYKADALVNEIAGAAKKK